MYLIIRMQPSAFVQKKNQQWDGVIGVSRSGAAVTTPTSITFQQLHIIPLKP